MVKKEEIKIFAEKYLSHLANDLQYEVREHIAGSSEWLPKSDLRERLGKINIRHDIVDVPQFKGDWIKLVDKIEEISEKEYPYPSAERLEADRLASDLVNKIHKKLREVGEFV